MIKTHEVFNQPPLLQDYNLFSADVALQEALKREDGSWGLEIVQTFGGRLGRAETLELGALANCYEPQLHTHDRFGHRIDQVIYHPAWHELMEIGVEAGLTGIPWLQKRSGAHAVRAAMFMMMNQVENGVCCPITMTFAAVPALRKQPELADIWEPLLTSNQYDKSFTPANKKKGAIMGMAMTEKQGGSDVRANTTKAQPIGKSGPGQAYLLTGHKWFCSAPMSDAFLTLAQTSKGLTCFFVPRWTPEGKSNNFFIQRLKDKLGNRSNASSEIEYADTWAMMVGEEGRGVPTIIEMVHHTRLDCVLGSAGLMRGALVQALHHTKHRSAFGKTLNQWPLMENVLADLCIESEAATILAMRLARSFDRREDKEFEAPFGRIATAISKYWVCKRAGVMVQESLECLGGSGYVEESIMPRYFRESPLNSIWEGSGNVNCLDVLRAMAKEREVLQALQTELALSRGQNKKYDNYIQQLAKDLRDPDLIEYRARHLVERMALGLQGSLLLRYGNPVIAEAFCSSRLAGQWGHCFGTLPTGLKLTPIIERSFK